MGPLARLTAASLRSVSTWLQFAAGMSLLIALVTAIDLANARGGTSFGRQTMSSLVFALELAVGATVGGILLWLLMRALQGKYAVQGFRDSVLWSASIISALVVFARVIR